MEIRSFWRIRDMFARGKGRQDNVAVTILAHFCQISRPLQHARVDLLREERWFVCEDVLDSYWLQSKQLWVID